MLKFRFAILTLFSFILLISGVISCAGGGTGGGTVVSLEITNCPTSGLQLGGTQQLTVVAKDANGNVVGSVTLTYNSSNPRFASVDASGLLQAIYPGAPVITASTNGIVSNDCMVTVNPPANAGMITDITDNAFDDNWGPPNNFWKMIARGRVLWQQANNTDILLHNLSDPVGTNTLIKTVGGNSNADFMALGSGAGQNDILATWREGLTNTFVDDGSGSPTDLGAIEAEENTVDAGCLFFRKNTVQDIMLFTFAAGLSTAGSDDVLGLSNPISSECKATWLRDEGGMIFTLIYYDGNSETTVDTGLAGLLGTYYFAKGRIVYSLNNDIFLYDTTSANPQPQNITNKPLDLNNFVKTDGDSIIFTRDVDGSGNFQVVLYDIASGQSTVISTTSVAKDGGSLDIDLKQAVWTEGAGTDLFFHNGNGEASGTSQVTLPAPLSPGGFNPYISGGVVTWIGKDVDEDVYVME